MTTIGKLTKKIKAWRKLGASYETIGSALNINRAEARRIDIGKYPGEQIAQRLGLPVVCHACKRRVPAPRRETEPTPKIGQPGWLAYWLKEPIKEMEQ